MNNLVKWFKENGYSTVEEGRAALADKLGIKVKAYEEYDVYVFNYCQIESPKTHPVVMECRGLILDNNFNPLCRPFDRFFNLGEALNITSDFDILESVVYEKVDGSLVKVWYDGDLWQVATRGTAYAESENYTGVCFQKLILNAFGCEDLFELDEKLSQCLSVDNTYIFEYTSPENRVVTPYTDDKMYLLGIRNKYTGDILTEALESTHKSLVNEGLNVHLPRVYKFSSAEDMRLFANNLEGLQEGFVAHDLKNNLQLKVKSETYVAVHRLRGECLPTPNKIMTLVVTNETEEYLVYFPEEVNRFLPYVDLWNTLNLEIERTYNKYKDIEDQKEFALAVKDFIYNFVMFQARSKGADVIHTLHSLDTNKKVKLLSQYKETA